MSTVGSSSSASDRGARPWLCEPPHALAALRIVVPAMILLSPGLREGARVAALDRALWIVPEGLHAFVAFAPISRPIALAVEVVTVFAALLAIVGIRARPALAVLLGGAFYLFSVAQLTGFVWHDMHLLWLTALLAASPCDRAFAVDTRGKTAGPSVAYGVPLVLARAILACVYVFPGLHKLWAQGLGWALSDNLRNQLLWKAFERGELPFLRLDQHPTLLALGGLFVLAFELSAPLVFLHPRTRLAGAILGLCFHLSAQLVFGIPFASLWACYVILIDCEALAKRFGLAGAGSSEAKETSRALPIAVGALVLTGALVQGFRGQTSSYPFACYPTFEHRPGTTIADLEIRVRGADGTLRVLPEASPRSQRQWGTIWALAGVTAPVDPARLRAYYTSVAVSPAPLEVRFVRVERSVIPEDRGAPPSSEVELYRFVPSTPDAGER